MTNTGSSRPSTCPEPARHPLPLSASAPSSSTAKSSPPATPATPIPNDHAEEIALTKIPAREPRLPHAAISTSLEPCSKRASRPRTCTDLILAAHIPPVVLAWREPAGIEVVEFPDLAEEVKQINAKLLGYVRSAVDGRQHDISAYVETWRLL
jgi:tRNA(Arg) A34 adenosine deaminase TadA